MRHSSFELKYAKQKFEQFVNDLPRFYRFSTRPIIWSYVRSWFSYRKTDWSAGRKMVYIWIDNGWCERRASHGIVIKYGRRLWYG